MAMPWECLCFEFALVQHVAPLCLQWTLALLFPLNWAGSMGSVYLCYMSMHRDETRVQMVAKMFPHLKLLCWLFMSPTLGFDTKQRNSVLIKFGVLYN